MQLFGRQVERRVAGPQLRQLARGDASRGPAHRCGARAR
jgi:hypothetical protein